jgi:hypothetical protein
MTEKNDPVWGRLKKILAILRTVPEPEISAICLKPTQQRLFGFGTQGRCATSRSTFPHANRPSVDSRWA